MSGNGIGKRTIRELMDHITKEVIGSTRLTRFRNTHTKLVLNGFAETVATSLKEHGKFSFRPLGAFEVQKSSGAIKFTPSAKFQQSVFGKVSNGN